MNILISAARTDRGFWAAIALCVALKILLAWLFPVMGDEAYFTVWGTYPALGYYDHPPMAGWLMWLMMSISQHPVVMRLPAILTPIALSLTMYAMLKPRGEDKARTVALVFLISPIFLVPVIVTTDIPLVLFGALSAFVLYRALETRQTVLFMLSGVFLGLAFLSKYFAVLLGLAYLFYFLFFARSRWREFLLLFLAVLPFGLLNLYYNYNQCWYNILFNLVNRHGGGDGGFALVGLGAYLLSLLYLFMPWVVWHFWRERREAGETLKHSPLLFFIIVGGFPLVLFLLMSGFRTVGLHWLLVFIVLFYPAYTLLPHASLRKVLVYTGWFSAVHAAVVVILLLIPVQWLSAHRSYHDIFFYMAPQTVAAALEQVEADFYATGSYSASATLAYNSSKYWSVFGTGSRYAREDDRITDWRALSGKDMLFFRRKGIREDRIAPFFESIDIITFDAGGTRLEAALAKGFDYESYHREVLSEIRRRYYQVPECLPMGNCDFLERYFEKGAE